MSAGEIDNDADARMALEEAAMDVRADMGEDAVEAGWSDIVHSVCDRCTPKVANELLRREGLNGPGDWPYI